MTLYKIQADSLLFMIFQVIIIFPSNFLTITTKKTITNYGIFLFVRRFIVGNEIDETMFVSV